MIHVYKKNKYLTVRFGIHILISRFGLFIFYTNMEKRFVYIYKFIYVPLPQPLMTERMREEINKPV